jgi:hypothetical protein
MENMARFPSDLEERGPEDGLERCLFARLRLVRRLLLGPKMDKLRHGLEPGASPFSNLLVHGSSVRF